MEYSYTTAHDMPGILIPRLSLTLIYGQRSLAVAGLLDSGSSVNVLPYGIGIELG
jgi:hypothetical protein